MGKRPLIRLAAVAAGGVLGLAAAAPALANGDDTTITADLRQSNVTADDKEFAAGSGDCDGVDVQNGEAGWVFVWPGNEVTDLVSLELDFDTDGDSTADMTLTEADATETLDEGTLKVWVTTDATWVLIRGTSEVKGALPPPAEGQEPQFNLTHICGEGDNGDGENGDGENGDGENGDGENGDGENGDGENGDGENGDGEDEDGEDEGLPVTGPGVGTLLLLSGGLLAAGSAMLLVRRRRNLLGLLNG